MERTVDSRTKQDIDFIRRLCDDKLIGWPHMDFLPVDLGDFDASTWFENHLDVYRQHAFVEFARDGTGSGYCLWYYPGLKEPPPVVFWGSEGEFYFVAGSVQDFIRQLGSGKALRSGFWDEDPKGNVERATLRRRCEDYVGPWRAEPDEICARGRSAHPPFEEWVSQYWE
jgi:hypothetical protein